MMTKKHVMPLVLTGVILASTSGYVSAGTEWSSPDSSTYYSSTYSGVTNTVRSGGATYEKKTYRKAKYRRARYERVRPVRVAAPEIDVNAGGSAVALLVAVMLIAAERTRRI